MLFDRIELFVNVAKHQNLGKTAREMHVSASSVCQRLKSLENDFGVKLYKKKKTGIELTGAGQTVLTTATEVLNQLDTLKKTLTSDSQPAVQSLTIGGTYSPSAKYLLPAIAAFRKKQANIKVKLLTSHKTIIEKLVRESEVEVALVQSPSNSAEFEMEFFAHDHLMFFAHPMHPLAKKKRLAMEDLSGVPLVVREGRGATEKMLKQLERQGVVVNVALRCLSPDAVKAAVRRNTGIGILFKALTEEDIKRGLLKQLSFPGSPKLVGSSYIISNKTKPLSSPAAAFLAVLRSFKNPLNRSENIGQ